MDDGARADDLAEVEALIDAGHWTDALKALGPLRRSSPSDPGVWRAQALALRGAGELQEAQVAADRWASLDESSTEALRLRVDLLTERNKHYAAVEVAEQLAARTPDDADAYYRLAQAQRGAGLVSRARESIHRSLALDPLRWQSHELAGLIEMGASRPADAAPHFRDALRLDPDNGQLALSLQRALEAADARQATARSTASKRKKASKQRARDVGAADKDRERQQAKAERQLHRGSRPTGADGNPISRWRQARTWIAVLIVLAVLAYVRFR
ncbi:MAG TPA: tetratricopeptide repeat protein [Acidimicrobiales bacterium]|nr:tetratricopeptide repeat protein [Acidimicrobiales bacterium]